jgi:hypothetical protein
VAAGELLALALRPANVSTERILSRARPTTEARLCGSQLRSRLHEVETSGTRFNQTSDLENPMPPNVKRLSGDARRASCGRKRHSFFRLTQRHPQTTLVARSIPTSQQPSCQALALSDWFEKRPSVVSWILTRPDHSEEERHEARCTSIGSHASTRF